MAVQVRRGTGREWRWVAGQPALQKHDSHTAWLNSIPCLYYLLSIHTYMPLRCHIALLSRSMIRDAISYARDMAMKYSDRERCVTCAHDA